jgi:hypothetical protein
MEEHELKPLSFFQSLQVHESLLWEFFQQIGGILSGMHVVLDEEKVEGLVGEWCHS